MANARLLVLAILMLSISASVSLFAQAAPTYTIGTVTPASIAAGANGATLTLTGTLPDFTQGTYQVCFYAGSGATAPLTPTLVAGAQTIAVPASTIQGIPAGNFTATNGYAVQALVYVVAAGQTCDGETDGTLTNRVTEPVVDPTLGAYTGPASVPQTNSSTGIQAAPTTITLSGSNFVAATVVTFGSFGTVSPVAISPTSLVIPVPAAFSASPPQTTATLGVCNVATASSSYCTSPATAITLTVTSLAASAGTITATPTPVLVIGKTTFAAQFKPSASSGSVGAPSGTVAFTADGATVPSSPLILDKTSTFTAVSSSLTIPVTATPVIAPAAGSYLNSTTVSITDTTSGAAIYYTTDGSTPTTESTLYAAPFIITQTQTITAIAAVSGARTSAPASAAYTITTSPPAKLVFQTGPITTAINTAITPAVQVAIQDADGNLVPSSTLPVTISLSSNPAEGTLAGTLTVNAVNGIATFPDLAINNVNPAGTSYALRAISGRLTPATSAGFNITPYPITLTVDNALVGIASTLNGTIKLGHAAGTGGVLVTLASSAPANVTIAPATVTIAAGGTTGTFTYTGVAAGPANLTATATNYQTGTVAVAGTAAQVSLGTIPPVAPGQMVSLALSLPMPAPPGGTTVTFTSTNTNVATITQSVFVPEGQRTAAANPQITGVIIGTTTITASAPGFAPDRRTVNVTVVATFNPTTTQLNLVTSTNTTLNISAPAQAGGITFTLSSDDPTISTVPASVTIIQGSTNVSVPITGVKSGSTTIRADSAGVTEATGTVNVVSDIVINENPIVTGVLLTRGLYLYLPVSPSVPTTVTIKSTDPSIATISNAQTTVGTQTVVYNNVVSTTIGPIYVQGQKQGSTTLTVSAPGYTTGTSTIRVDGTGFIFSPYSGSTFSTTTFSSPSTITLYTALINPATGNLDSLSYPFNPGIADVSVPVTSSDTTVGTVVTSPVVFHAGDSADSFNFKPAGAGTAVLKLGTPAAPFSVSSFYQTYTGTVTAPQIQNGNVTTGVNLQNSYYAYLPVAPPSPVTMTVTSNDPSIVKISASNTTVGTTTLTFPNTGAPGVGTGYYIYLQGQKAGTTTLTISAPGYQTGTTTVSVYPTGFGINYYQGNFNTQTNSQPTQVSVYADILNPSDLTVNYEGLTISPGVAAISVPVTSSNTKTGTISTSPLVFHPGDSGLSTNFAPLAAGTSTIALGVPAGYSTPANYQSIVATVTAPTLAVQYSSGSVTTGSHLYTSNYVYLTTAPTSAATVTITSSDPTKVTLSTDPAVVGTASVTFTNVTTTNVGTIYIQGQSVGSATLTGTSSGYTSATSTAVVDPSGFGFYYYTTNFTTTTFSQASQLSYLTYVLDPTSLQVINNQALNPGTAPISLNVTSSAPAVGTISQSPVVFNAGNSSMTNTFQPVSAGQSTISIDTPAGFSKPSQYQSIVATVTAPAITVNNVETGKGLENSMYLYLPQTPPNPVTVTVKSNGPAIATISTDGTVVGGTTLTFTNVTSTGIGQIFIQGQSIGATTITVSAPGYTNGEATVTVDPAGFTLFYYQNSFSTTTTSNPTTLYVYPASLTPGTLTVINPNLQVNPGIGTVNVPVVSSNTAVGTITTSPVPFVGGNAYQTTTFQPVAAGTSTITLGTPDGFSTPSQYQQDTATVTNP